MSLRLRRQSTNQPENIAQQKRRLQSPPEIRFVNPSISGWQRARYFQISPSLLPQIPLYLRKCDVGQDRAVPGGATLLQTQLNTSEASEWIAENKHVEMPLIGPLTRSVAPRHSTLFRLELQTVTRAKAVNSLWCYHIEGD